MAIKHHECSWTCPGCVFSLWPSVSQDLEIVSDLPFLLCGPCKVILAVSGKFLYLHIPQFAYKEGNVEIKGTHIFCVVSFIYFALITVF